MKLEPEVSILVQFKASPSSILLKLNLSKYRQEILKLTDPVYNKRKPLPRYLRTVVKYSKACLA